ncbi:PucR family transcriptional regulator [Mycolicibacterium sp. J2]|uniref:PucR family transcriptional regulator n=1 Tax=Mycolicibacterium sp. J2 TaxID=2993511 RepID=UPI00224AFB05|nr:PucR family transcriptional regulator [Mycolicibacterium sp. J2]MCX2711296.1 helix-turn-helix domain-containing protein [Mycolicibacterium sp. J2]
MAEQRPLAVLVERVRQQSDAIVAKVLARLRSEVPDYLHSSDNDETVRVNISDYLDEMLAWIDRGAEPDNISFDSAIRWRADEGLTLSSLLHAYRLGAATIWDELASLAATKQIDKAALVAATPSIFAWMNTNSLRAHAVFREIEIRDARRNEQVRAALLDTVLFNESSIGALFWDAVAALGLPRSGHLTVLAATAMAPVVEQSPPDIETLISAHPAVQGSWFRLAAHSQVGIVALRPSRADALDGIVESICADVPILIGLSGPFAAISDCSKARAQAQVAMNACGKERPSTRYNRDVLPVLLASSPDAAEAVVTATLGPVLALPPERARPFIATIQNWLRLGQSVAATAEIMHCHRNTVNYRLRRFAELTGRPLTDTLWLAQVALALEALGAQSALPTADVL